MNAGRIRALALATALGLSATSSTRAEPAPVDPGEPVTAGEIEWGAVAVLMAPLLALVGAGLARERRGPRRRPEVDPRRASVAIALQPWGGVRRPRARRALARPITSPACAGNRSDPHESSPSRRS